MTRRIWITAGIVIAVLIALAFVFTRLQVSGGTGGGPGPNGMSETTQAVRLVSLSHKAKTIPCPCSGATELTSAGATGSGDGPFSTTATKADTCAVSGVHTAHTYVKLRNVLNMTAFWMKVVGTWCNTNGPPMFLNNVKWVFSQDSWANIEMSPDNSYIKWSNRYTGSTECKAAGTCTDAIYYKQVAVKACLVVRPLCVTYHPWIRLHLGEGPKHSGDFG